MLQISTHVINVTLINVIDVSSRYRYQFISQMSVILIHVTDISITDISSRSSCYRHQFMQFLSQIYRYQLMEFIENMIFMSMPQVSVLVMYVSSCYMHQIYQFISQLSGHIIDIKIIHISSCHQLSCQRYRFMSEILANVRNICQCKRYQLDISLSFKYQLILQISVHVIDTSSCYDMSQLISIIQVYVTSFV